MTQITKLMVANRGEIAIRVFRAATELGLRTVALYAREDRFSLHRFKADESYLIGEGEGPIGAYLNIEDVIGISKDTGVDAIHPGYGFLSENPDLPRACSEAGIIFVGPPAEVMEALGDKLAARKLAQAAGVPVIPATGALGSIDDAVKAAKEIGYPLMLKASWGGGGRGMRMIDDEKTLKSEFDAARREAKAAFGRDDVYLEKRITDARHVEVQILCDAAGGRVHLFDRDCSVQRRNQKVVERAPAPYLDAQQRNEICAAALALAKEADYINAGTVEFLLDAESGEFYFIEVNPRVQVEHTVTEEVTGVDIVKAQIGIAGGNTLAQCGVPAQDEILLNGHAMQCRITTEDPANKFVPDYGRIKVYRGATGFGIRLDGGTAYSGAVITPYYDSLLEKVTAWAPTPEETIRRMDRALREFRIRGVATNLVFLENLINHPRFTTCDYNTRFIDETPSLFEYPQRRDRASRLLRFIADVSVNGNAEVEGRQRKESEIKPPVPKVPAGPPPEGLKQKLDKLGPEKFASWMCDKSQALITDTTFRDAHQSLLATRMRTDDLTRIAPVYAHSMPGLFSIECWGGATFDVAMRFLKEDPWERLARLREAMPNHLLQMLLRASNAVGYTNYPDNVVRFFIRQAKDCGIDLFRIFDALNWAENMTLSIEAVCEEGGVAEAALCYTGDMLARNGTKYDLDYYLGLARDFQQAGAHIIGIKDMAGLCKPEAARVLIKALKEETGLPVHFHTHDTSGGSVASVLAAVDAGADAVDAAMDSMSGLTSQPNLGAVVAALQDTDRDSGLDLATIEEISHYWEAVRGYYYGFESDVRSGTADVYRHEMPGGQYTNLREQARALGVHDRWPEVAKAYSDVNEMFGDIVKVTPTSKVVGDLALMMVTQNLSKEDVLDPDHDMSFPDSVIALFRGDLGQPPGGWPKDLQKKVLKKEKAYTERPGARLADVDLDKTRQEAANKIDRKLSDYDLASYLMYPNVFETFAKERRQYGDVSVLPTPVFFHGLEPEQEIAVDIEKGKTLIIRYVTASEVDDEGHVKVFFELNGQPRIATVTAKGHEAKELHPKADPSNNDHVAAPMPGLITNIAVDEGQTVEEGDVLLALEAMKMETAVHAHRGGTVKEIHAKVGTQADSHDLLMVIAE